MSGKGSTPPCHPQDYMCVCVCVCVEGGVDGGRVDGWIRQASVNDNLGNGES